MFRKGKLRRKIWGRIKESIPLLTVKDDGKGAVRHLKSRNDDAAVGDHVARGAAVAAGVDKNLEVAEA
jgi:hypothetical protein